VKSSFRFPAFLSVLVFLFTSCGGGGGGSSTPPLAVHTDNATSITQNEAVLNGTVNPNGTAAEAWFEYGTNPNLASYDNTINQSIVAGTASQPVNQPLDGLAPGAMYYFRLVASDGSEWVEGEISSFTTHNPPPAVTTENATSITLNGATLNGSVNPNGAATNAWFEYGPDPNLVSFTATDNQNMGSGGDPVALDNTLSGLDTGATYYFRLVAASVEGEVKGAIKSFSTAVPLPAATTGNATNITTTGATFNGIVNPNGFDTEAWFEYGTDNTLATFAETAHQPMGSEAADNSISATVTSLTSWRTWYFRTVARSTAEPGEITKGAIHSFPTGEYYVAFGDSITFGSHDDIFSDDVSLDGRNSGGGFEPILNNLLTEAKGYPHTVVNAGVSGETSADGVSRIGSVLSGNPSANYFLILYGTNDALVPAVSKATYKANIQAIMTAIKNAEKIPYLAKVPYVDPTNPLFPAGLNFSDAAIHLYNQAIDELAADPLNGISVVPPDFYGWFQSHTGQLDDGIHPTGTGYQSMATLWFNELTD
jgi:lysophospholipase L1-like esterase